MVKVKNWEGSAEDERQDKILAKPFCNVGRVGWEFVVHLFDCVGDIVGCERFGDAEFNDSELGKLAEIARRFADPAFEFR